jgi:hypothetical protein
VEERRESVEKKRVMEELIAKEDNDDGSTHHGCLHKRVVGFGADEDLAKNERIGCGPCCSS